VLISLVYVWQLVKGAANNSEMKQEKCCLYIHRLMWLYIVFGQRSYSTAGPLWAGTVDLLLWYDINLMCFHLLKES